MGLLLRTILAFIILFSFAIILPAGFQLIEPVYNGIELTGATNVGWTGEDTIMWGASVGMLGLIVVVIFWWWYGDIRTDERQRQTFR